ncbi:MAG: hypothetical protein KHY89_00780 [Butyricicoccus pullicaecorum]|nr:hypothetical protein [Butyricicoccus pullicaecorum]
MTDSDAREESVRELRDGGVVLCVGRAAEGLRVVPVVGGVGYDPVLLGVVGLDVAEVELVRLADSGVRLTEPVLSECLGV